MQLTSTECFMTKVLNCGYGDLDLLDNVYSVLAEESCDIDDVIEQLQQNENLSLNSLLYEVYSCIKCEICEKSREILENEDLLNDFIEETGIKKIDVEFLEGCITDIEDSTVWANCQDTYFNCDIDQVVDFDKSVKYNVYELLKYLINFQVEEN